jgi:hypothetical protein
LIAKVSLSPTAQPALSPHFYLDIASPSSYREDQEYACQKATVSDNLINKWATKAEFTNEMVNACVAFLFLGSRIVTFMREKR